MLVESLTGNTVLRLDVPADFHEVPLDVTTEERTAAQLDVVDELELTSAEQREALSLYLEALARRIAGGAVRGTAFCAVQLAGRPSTATLTVALHATGSADPGLVVLGAAEAIRRSGAFDTVRLEELGSVPGVSAVAERPAVPTDDPTGRPGETLREMSVLVPVRGQPLAALVTLCTPCLEDWDVYTRVLLEVARSVRVQRHAAGVAARL